MIGKPVRTILLDTCTLLDLSIAPDVLSSAATDTLSDLSTRLLVSAATAWEVAIKTRHGKLPGGERLLDSWAQSLLDLQAEPLSIEHDDAIRAGSLPWAHRDPFDRMLVAQAARRNVALATRDVAILGSGIVTTIDTKS